MFNYFAISGLCIGIINLGLAILISIYGKNRLHKVWSFVNYSISLWGFGMLISGSTMSHSIAFIGWRIFNVGIILISVIYFHVIYLFCNLQTKKFLIFSYVQGLIFIGLTVFTNLMFGDKLFFAFDQFYYFRASIFHYILMFIWTIIVGRSFYELYKYIRKSSGIAKTQAQYLFVAMMFGFGGGLNTAPAAWGFDVYPYGQIFVCAYGLLATYAIFRYRIMDIKVAFTRIGIFIFVYSVILGFPFGLAVLARNWLMRIFGNEWFWVPMISLLMLATVGPFIYLFLQHKAEDRLLKEERKIQQFLMQASAGMTTIRDLKKLLGLIIHLVSNTLKLNNAAIYLFDSNSNQYVLKATRFKRENPITIAIDDLLIQQLKKDKSPLVYEEIKMRADTENNSHILKEISSQMKGLFASVIVSTAIENNLLGFLILGERKSARMYTPDLLNALAVLSNQAALAIENARFYESDKENQALLYQSATLSEMGVMADSMGHQIKNHIQKMMGLAGTEAGMLEEFLKQGPSFERATELLKRYLEVFNRIEEQGKEGGELIASISKFSRLPQEAFKELKVAEILKTANDMLQFMIKFDQIDYEVDIAENLPSIYAHPILSEAFVNLIDNSYDAINEREERLSEPGYRGKISFQARFKDPQHIEIIISDNGMGIEKANLSHLFLPFYTTKATAAKGTGLGLYVLKRIIDNHKGRITVESEHLKGTAFTITLPIKAGA